MTTTLTPPSGFTPRTLTSWNRYFVPQSDTNVYRVGDAVKSAGGTDAAGIVAVTLHLGTGPARGIIVAVDPGLPATGGLSNGQKLSVPAAKLAGYYVWVDDDPSHLFAMVDDGLTPANSTSAAVGKYANFTPGASAAANGGSTSAIASSTLGSTSGCLQVVSLQPGSAYGAAATWLVKFAAHELANGGGQAVASGAIARSTAQLAGTPSAGDVGLGAAGQFYDPLQTVDASHPWVYYSASSTAYVKIGGGAATGSATPQPPGIAAAGTASAASHEDHVHPPSTAFQSKSIPSPGIYNFNAVTGLATDGTNTTTLASGTVPTLSGAPFYCMKVTTGGTVALDTLTTVGVNDLLYLSPQGTGQVWQRTAGVPLTGGPLVPDGNGGVKAGTPGVDFLPGVLMLSGLPVIAAPAGTFGANGALVLTAAGPAAASSSGLYDQGCFMYFPAGAINGSNAAGFYYAVGATDNQHFTVYNNTYTPSTGATAAKPVKPGTLAPFVSSAQSAYTPTLATFVPTHIVPVAPNSMGANGSIKQKMVVRNSGGANTKTIRTYFGIITDTTHQLGVNVASTTNTYNGYESTIQNKGATNVQNAPTSADIVSTAGVINSGAQDTTTQLYLIIGFLIANASDWLVIETVDVRIVPQA